MSAATWTERIADPSPRSTARMAGFFWLMTIVGGTLAMLLGGRFIASTDAAASAANILAHEASFRWAIAANLIAGACYLAATVLVYDLLKPVNRNVSLLAALFSVMGCTVGVFVDTLRFASLVVLGGAKPLSAFTVEQVQALAFMFLRLNLQAYNIGFLFFGLHCLLVGVLILRSIFLPRLVGALMVSAGLGWLTLSLASLLSPPLVRSLFPYILVPGFLGEASLTLWLLVSGVNVLRWQEQASVAREGRLVASARP
jgi:MFS family permease